MKQVRAQRRPQKLGVTVTYTSNAAAATATIVCPCRHQDGSLCKGWDISVLYTWFTRPALQRVGPLQLRLRRIQKRDAFVEEATFPRAQFLGFWAHRVPAPSHVKLIHLVHACGGNWSLSRTQMSQTCQLNGRMQDIQYTTTSIPEQPRSI